MALDCLSPSLLVLLAKLKSESESESDTISQLVGNRII